MRLLTLLLAVLTLGLAAPAVAPAQQDPLVPVALNLTDRDRPPPGYEVTPRQARRMAERAPEVRQLRREEADLAVFVEAPLYLIGESISYDVVYEANGRTVADIVVDGRTGRIRRAWTGPQAYFPLTRGAKPPVAGPLNSPWIWFPLAALFFLPFFDPRRPFRLLHLDLLVLLGFGLSQVFFNRGEIDVSVPLVYPLLLYLVVRLALAGFRPRPRGERLVPYARVSWLAVGLVALVAFRVALNVVDSVVTDVGYASVIGADRIAHGEELYIFNNVNGDTYGPITYLAYLPFELIFPNDGTWGDVPAAHAAAITFDLVTICGLMLLGTRLRAGGEGRRLGLALAFAWAAYPFTTYALQANTNDGLVAMLLVLTLLALSSAPARGALLGLSAAAKFAPLALAPLLATGPGDEPRRRAWPRFAASLVGVCAVAIFLYLPDGGLREFWDATLGFQMSRDSPFSLWGLHPSLEWLQHVVTATALLLAVVVAFVPGQRDLRSVAALGGAVLIAVELPAIHWFYFYLVWIAPFAFVALLGAYRWSERPTAVRAGRMDEGTAAPSG